MRSLLAKRWRHAMMRMRQNMRCQMSKGPGRSRSYILRSPRRRPPRNAARRPIWPTPIVGLHQAKGPKRWNFADPSRR